MPIKTEEFNCALLQVDPKTFRKCAWVMVNALDSYCLERYIILLFYRFGQIDCLTNFVHSPSREKANLAWCMMEDISL